MKLFSRKNGILWAILGLILGLSIGLAFIYAEKKIKDLLVELLNDEAKVACDCQVNFEEIKVSLLSLTAKAKNASLRKNNEIQFKIKYLRAFFKLNNIFNKEIPFSLVFDHAESISVSPKSSLYRYIDQLSTSKPPEQQKPNRWKARLEKIKLKNFSFRETLTANATLVGTKASISVERTADDNFKLEPKVENLSIQTSTKEIPLGTLIGKNLLLKEKDVTLEELKLVRSDAVLYFTNTTWDKSTPFIMGDLDYTYGEDKSSFPSAIGKYALELTDSTPIFRIISATLALKDTVQNLVEPIVINESSITGKMLVSAKTQTYKKLLFNNVTAEVFFKGDISDPLADVNAVAENVLIGERPFPHLKLRGLFNLDAGNFDLTQGASSTDFINFSGEIKTYKTPEVNSKLNVKLSLLGDLTGEIKLKNELVVANLKNPQESIKATLSNSSQNIDAYKLTISTQEFEPKLATPQDPEKDSCFDINLNSDYAFDISSPLNGNGIIETKDVKIGCAPYQANAKSLAPLKITAGKLDFNGLSISGLNTELSMNGSLDLEKGFNAKAAGTLQLDSFLPLVGFLDELSGNVKTDFNITGPINKPELNGKAKIENLVIADESAGISLTDGKGELILKPSGNALDSGFFIYLPEITGNFNNGNFKATGELFPFDFDRSNLSTTFKDAFFSPIDNGTIITSGTLKLTPTNLGLGKISGDIKIDQGEFEKKINLTRLLGSLPRELFKEAAPQKPQSSPALPNILLDVNINSPRNLFILTNWLGAELSANLAVRGNLQKPEISGKIESLDGWFGLENRRFDITSGAIEFSPPSLSPKLRVLGEAYIRSTTAETTFVTLEATGELTNPKIKLSSDRDLSEKEIMTLITQGQSLPNQTLANTVGRSMDWQKKDNKQLERFALDPRNLLENLSNIDALYLEPIYNLQTGLVEPTVIARKNLSKNVYLRGQSSLGSSANEAKAGIYYSLSSKMTASTTIETSALYDQAVGADLTYTILARQNNFLNINFTGNEAVNEEYLRASLRLGENSRLKKADLEFITNSIYKTYSALGFFSPKVTIDCLVQGDFCKDLNIEIQEGKESEIAKVTLNGDILPKEIHSLDLDEDLIGEIATQKILENVNTTLTNRLRSEGYITARVTPKYINTESLDKKVTLQIHITTGKPVSFSFVGNTIFTPADFLETIKLFERKFPFGNNTINILVQNIERKYREAGYIYASISQTRSEDTANERINYIINIDEGSQATVGEVSYLGLPMSENKFLKGLKNRSPEAYKRITRIKLAIAEDLELSCLDIEAELKAKNYPEASTKYKIEAHDSSNDLNVIFVVEAGEMEEVASETPETPSPIETMIIKNVSIEGNENINPEIVLKQLQIKAGDAWDENKILSSKNNLLKLGLFSRVEIKTNDESTNIEKDVVVSLTEKPLNTLEIGGGANSTFGIHAFGEATNRKWLADGRSLSLRLDGYYDPRQQDISRGIASARYLNPVFLGSDFSHTEELRFQKLELANQEFDLNRISFLSFLYRNWKKSGISGSFGHTISRDNLTTVSPDAILTSLDKDNLLLSTLGASFALDRRDDPLNPTSGYSFRLEPKLSSTPLGSDANFYSMLGRFSVTSEISPDLPELSFAFHSRSGAAWHFGNTDEIPITQRFYAGGRTSIRGFQENSLGPRGAQKSVLGGDILFTNNAELRYLLTDYFSLHSFFDFGSVFLRSQSIDAKDLRYSTGLGLKYISQIGPIGIDVGFPLDRLEDEDAWKVHFNVGSNF